MGFSKITISCTRHNCSCLPHRGGVRDEDSKSVPMMASNAAYGVVSHGQGSGGDDVAMYEMVGQSVASSATRPTADHPSDYLQSSQGPPPLTHHTQDPAYDVIADHSVTHYREQPCGFVAKSVFISRTLLCFNIHIQQQLDVSLCSQSLWNSALR